MCSWRRLAAASDAPAGRACFGEEGEDDGRGVESRQKQLRPSGRSGELPARPRLAVLGHVLADGHADGRRDDLGHVQLPRLPGRVRVSHVRPAAAGPRQRRDLRQLLGAVHRPLLLPGAAAVRGPDARRGPRLLDGLGVEHRARPRAPVPAARLQSGPRGGRAAVPGRLPAVHPDRRHDLAVHGHDRESRRAAALRQPLVSARHLLVDHDQHDPRHLHPPLHDSGDQQRRLPRPLHSLYRRLVDHAGRLRPDLLLSAGERPQSAVQPQALAGRLLVARPVLSVRRHPPLPVQPDRRLGRDPGDHHLDAPDHPGVDGRA